MFKLPVKHTNAWNDLINEIEDKLSRNGFQYLVYEMPIHFYDENENFWKKASKIRHHTFAYIFAGDMRISICFTRVVTKDQYHYHDEIYFLSIEDFIEAADAGSLEEFVKKAYADEFDLLEAFGCKCSEYCCELLKEALKVEEQTMLEADDAHDDDDDDYDDDED